MGRDIWWKARHLKLQPVRPSPLSTLQLPALITPARMAKLFPYKRLGHLQSKSRLSDTNLLGNHPEFFKVDHSVNFAVVAQVDEGEIFLDDRPEGNNRRLDVVSVDEVPVATHVTRRIHQLLHLCQQSQILGGELLPGRLEPRD